MSRRLGVGGLIPGHSFASGSVALRWVQGELSKPGESPDQSVQRYGRAGVLGEAS